MINSRIFKVLDLKAAIQLVGKTVQETSYKGSPNELYDPINYIMGLGGKRLRPVLAVLGYQAFNNEPEKALPLAKAIELFHNFTLVHDDIMDDAPLRRGQATVHEKWNDSIAILAGDAMLIKVYDHFLEGGYVNLAELLRVFNKTAIEVCEGQQMDMNFETRSDVSVEDYIEMIRLKTSVLVGGALQLGALAAGASKEKAQLIYDFGVNIGLAFQLKDDYLDCFGDPEKFGKQVGGDIISNKKTFMMLKALEKDASGKLAAWLTKSSFDKEEKVEAVKAIYLSEGIDQLAFDEMDKFNQKGLSALEALNLSKEQQLPLAQFAQVLMERTT